MSELDPQQTRLIALRGELQRQIDAFTPKQFVQIDTILGLPESSRTDAQKNWVSSTLAELRSKGLTADDFVNAAMARKNRETLASSIVSVSSDAISVEPTSSTTNTELDGDLMRALDLANGGNVSVRVLGQKGYEDVKRRLEAANYNIDGTRRVVSSRGDAVLDGVTRPVDAIRTPETLTSVDAYLVSRGYSAEKVATMTPLAKDKHAAGLRSLDIRQNSKYDEFRQIFLSPDFDEQRKTYFLNDALRRRQLDKSTYDALEKMFVATEVQLMRTATEQTMASAVQRGAVGEDASEIMTLSENNVRYDERLVGARCIGPDGEFAKLDKVSLDKAKSVVVSLVGGGNIYRLRNVGKEGVDELLKLKPGLDQAKNGRYKVDVSALEQLILNAGIDSAQMSKVLSVLIDPVHADGGAFADVAVTRTNGKVISYASSGFDPQPLLDRIRSKYGIDPVSTTLGWMVCEYLALRKDPSVGKSILEPLFKPDEIIDPSPGSQYQVGTMNPLKAVITRGAFARSNTSLGSMIGDVTQVTGMSRETLARGGWLQAIRAESALKMADQVNTSLAILKVLNKPGILVSGDGGQTDAKTVWKEALGSLKTMRAQGQITEATAEQIFRLMTEYVFMSLQTRDPIVAINMEDPKSHVELGDKAYDMVKQLMVDPNNIAPDKDGRATISRRMLDIYDSVNDAYSTRLNTQGEFAIQTEIDPRGTHYRRQSAGAFKQNVDEAVAGGLLTVLMPGARVVRKGLDWILGRKGE